MSNITYTSANRYTSNILSHLEQAPFGQNSNPFKQVVIIGCGNIDSARTSNTDSCGASVPIASRCPQVDEIVSSMRCHAPDGATLKLIEIDDDAHRKATASVIQQKTAIVTLDDASLSTRDLTCSQDRKHALGTNNHLIIMTQVLHHATRCYSLKRMSESQKAQIQNIMKDIFHSLSQDAAIYMDTLSFLLIKNAFGHEKNITNHLAKNAEAVFIENLTYPTSAPLTVIHKRQSLGK